MQTFPSTSAHEKDNHMQSLFLGLDWLFLLTKNFWLSEEKAPKENEAQ